MRWLFIILFLVIGLNADTLHATYKVEYGIFGKMGVADTYLSRYKNRYNIKIVAKATGLAKLLSGKRVEIYMSSGKIVNGTLIPDVFAKQISHSGKKRVKTYHFDHQNRTITFDEMRYRDKKLKSSRHEKLSYYANNDILTLYFNISKMLNGCKKPFDKELIAVGAEKKTGHVKVETLLGKARKKTAKLLGEGSCYLKVTIYQKLFGSKGGELYLVMRKDDVVTKALLKDVIMFGDIRGKLSHLDHKR